MEALDQGSGVGIGGGIERVLRYAIARQEILDSQHVGVIERAHHDRTGPDLDQADPAQDQGPHDALAEFRFGDHQGAKLFGPDQDRFHRAAGSRIDQRRPPRKLSDLGKKLARLLLHDEFGLP